MDLRLAGKGFVVLGASRGLGRAAAEVLHAEGAAVVLAARRQEAVEAAASAVGSRAHPVALDVGSPDVDALQAVIERALPSLDGVLVNSGGPRPGTALRLTDDDWDHAFRLLVRGPLALLRALRPRFATPAAVLWVTSSSVRQPLPDLDSSNLLRPGIAALVKSLALDLAPDVRVNALAPGRFDTGRVRELDEQRSGAEGSSVDEVRRRSAERIPLGRYGDPVEFGRVAAFLLSPAASYVTGTSIQVDGGFVTAVP